MTSITVQTWNIWCGGSRVHAGSEKLVEVARAYPADIRLFQESCFELAGDVSRSLGLSHFQQGYDNSVSATLPLRGVSTPSTEPFATAAIVTMEGKEVLVWSVHLAPEDYGPYIALDGADAPTVYATAGEEKRLQQIEEVMAQTQQLTESGDIPTIIAGDFNSPAGSDWAQRSDRPTMAWPSVDLLVDRGYKDAFRVVHPDAEAVRGITWSTIEPMDKEPRDRIDFVFTKDFDVLSARIIGNAPDGNAPDGRPDPTFASIGGVEKLIPHQAENAYPSDHLIVEVTLQLS